MALRYEHSWCIAFHFTPPSRSVDDASRDLATSAALQRSCRCASCHESHQNQKTKPSACALPSPIMNRLHRSYGHKHKNAGDSPCDAACHKPRCTPLPCNACARARSQIDSEWKRTCPWPCSDHAAMQRKRTSK